MSTIKGVNKTWEEMRKEKKFFELTHGMNSDSSWWRKKPEIPFKKSSNPSLDDDSSRFYVGLMHWVC